jgi:histidinol-phosphate phosphatase family protein
MFKLPALDQPPKYGTVTYSALFLDRDGVINTRIPGGYVRHPGEFEWMPGNPQAIAQLRPLFDYFFVVTNQQGIGKGLMTLAELEAVHDHMCAGLEKAGALPDRIYTCPDLKTVPENCRKPSPKMGLQAKADFPDIDFSRSVMVGDSLSDLQFGHNLGMRNVWVTGKAEDEAKIRAAIDDGLPVWQIIQTLQVLPNLLT